MAGKAYIGGSDAHDNNFAKTTAYLVSFAKHSKVRDRQNLGLNTRDNRGVCGRGCGQGHGQDCVFGRGRRGGRGGRGAQGPIKYPKMNNMEFIAAKNGRCYRGKTGINYSTSDRPITPRAESAR